MLDVRRSFRPRIRTSHVVAGAALVLITTGGASAAGLITGAGIKDNSVSTKDIKNGSLLLKDFKASERGKLVGPAGPTGPTGPMGPAGSAGVKGADGVNGTNGLNGAPGASAFTPPPSGTVIKGGGILSAQVSAAGVTMRDFAPLPFTTAAPLSVGAGQNLWFGAPIPASTADGTTNAIACPGTAAAPEPTPGNMCVYLNLAQSIAVGSADLIAGSSPNADAADSSGIYVYADSSAAGEMLLRYVWAYKAP